MLQKYFTVVNIPLNRPQIQPLWVVFKTILTICRPGGERFNADLADLGGNHPKEADFWGCEYMANFAVKKSCSI